TGIYTLSLHDALPISTGWEENTDPAFVKTGVKSLKNANLSQPGKAGIDFTVLIPHSARYAFLVFDYYQDCDSTVGDGLFVYVNGVNKIVPDDGVYGSWATHNRSEEHTSELQSRENLVCRLLLEKKKNQTA